MLKKKVLKSILWLFILLTLIFSFVAVPQRTVLAAAAIFVRTDGDDVNCDGTADAAYPGSGTGLACAVASIQQGVDLVEAGGVVNVGAGTYVENVDVNKHVHIVGAGSGDSDTVVTTPATYDNREGVFQISASGASTVDPVLLQDMRILPVSQAAISVGRFTEGTAQAVSYLTIDNVFISGTNVNPSTEQERGLYVDMTSTLDYLTVTDSAFNNLTYGWYFQKAVSADVSTVSNVMVTNTMFNHNNHKGIYVEKLTDAVFTDCTFDSNGFDASVLPSYFQAWSAGVDVNLKAGTYQNISFINPIVTNNATGGAKEGTGMTIKARDDGATYGPFPATLDNVQVTGGVFTGNERGIRFGEPGKDNATPTNVVVMYNSFQDNIPAYTGSDGSAYGALINATASGNTISAEKNFWGHGSGPDTSAMSVGDPNPHGAAAQGEAAVGEMTVIPWYGSFGTTPATEFVVADHSPILAYSAAIQGGVDAAFDGETVTVAAGTYVEQVIVDKNLTIHGAGAGSTILQSPAALEICWSTSSDHYAVLCIRDADNVTIDGMTVDGDGQGNANYRFLGVGFSNAGGTIDSFHVTGIRDATLSGAQHGVGIYAWNADAVQRTITVTNTTFDDFQKNAMALNASAATPLIVDVQDNVIIGAGITDVTAQNGIQVYGASITGTIAGNTISDIAYSGSSWVASSILNYFASPLIDNNIISNAQTGIYNYDGSAVLSNNTIGVVKTGDFGYGILASDPPEPMPSPFGAEDLAAADGVGADRATIVTTVTNNDITFTGSEVANSIGIEAVAGWTAEDLDITITNNAISGFDYGINVYQSTYDTGVFTNVVANQNCITNSVSYGLYSNSGAITVDAANNYWGSVFGPYHPTLNTHGNAAPVSDGVDFGPWLSDCGGFPVHGIQILIMVFR